MTHIIWLNGRHEHIESPEAFAQIINERLGSEAADLFKELTENNCGESVRSYIEEAVNVLRDVEPKDDESEGNLEYALDILDGLI